MRIALEVDSLDTIAARIVEFLEMKVPEGMMGKLKMLPKLAEAGYVGWLVVEAEQDPAKAHPLTYASTGYQNLSRLAEQAGFELASRASTN